MSTKTNLAIYKATFSEFLNSDPDAILGQLSNILHGNLNTNSREAWQGEITLLQSVLQPWRNEEADIIFEFSIPRMGKRIDVVLLMRGIILCLEFKVGQKDALQGDLQQVMDYALDLKNFHLLSRDRTIVPILVPTEHATATTVFQRSPYGEIYNPVVSGKEHLQSTIERVLIHADAYTPGAITDWVKSPYEPTPTIVEAARALYEHHSVADITRHDADSTDDTIAYIRSVIDRTRERREKSICFVTGVPGAGKTLVGLEVAVNQSYTNDGESKSDDGAVYLSGNGPLVAVLIEALARDNYVNARNSGLNKKLNHCRTEVRKFIQVIHRYRDNMLAKIKEPIQNGILEIDPDKAMKNKESGYSEVEHIAIFDEAQRSWTKDRIANYLKRGGTYGNKMKINDFPVSEAGFLIWSLDQREDWATIVCLVGGGQEINTGEAGISEWIRSLNKDFKHWKIHISPELKDPVYADGRVEELLRDNPNVTYEPRLHLASSKRSFRAERLAPMISSMLDFDPTTADQYAEVMANKYPILLTRDLEKARQWLRNTACGSERTGILVSKSAARYNPLALSVVPSDDDNTIHWFLEDIHDQRSSNYLEEAVTEIQVQGLELDYTCVVWDADMRPDGNKWTFYKYLSRKSSSVSTMPPPAPKWRDENNAENQKYMLNAYRVLLTRARQGMVICVPEGNPDDSTRLPEFYDPTYEYLKSLGLKEL